MERERRPVVPRGAADGPESSNASGPSPTLTALDLKGTARSGRVGLFGILIAALALDALILARGAPKLGGDSPGYLYGAGQLLAGVPLPEVMRSPYVGYLLLIAGCRLTGIGLLGVISIQIGLSLLAAVALYDLTRKIAGPTAGLLAAGLMALNPDLARFHTYILTESSYISCLVLALWGIVRAGEQRRLLGYGAALALVLVAAAIRPNAWLLLPITTGYWLSAAPLPQAVRWMASVLVVALFLALPFCVPFLRKAGQTQRPDALLRWGVVVGGYRPSYLQMPVDHCGEGQGWIAGLGYVARHPAASLQLGGVRVLAELGHTRPFYPRAHNIAISLFLLPLYGLAILGIAGYRRSAIVRLLLAVIGAHLLVIALTFADKAGRPLCYFLPQIGALAGCGWRVVMRDYVPRHLRREDNPS